MKDLPVSLAAGLPLGEAVYRALLQGIRAGGWASGERLREEEVAAHLKVSRTPVREAFGRLLAKGLVQQARGRGLVVRSLDTAEVFELYAMREILEGAAARLAAQQASPAEVEALKDQSDRFEAAKDAADLARLNRIFHESLFQAARNRYLDRALQELQDGIGLLGITTFSVPGRPAPAAIEHREITAAVADRDPERAERAARAHIREALRARLRLLQG